MITRKFGFDSYLKNRVKYHNFYMEYHSFKDMYGQFHIVYLKNGYKYHFNVVIQFVSEN